MYEFPFWREIGYKRFIDIKKVSDSHNRMWHKEWSPVVAKASRYTCQACGKNTPVGLGAVHHNKYPIYPDKKFQIYQAVKLKLIVWLCHDCHALVHNKINPQDV